MSQSFTLKDMQENLRAIYAEANDRNYSNEGIVLRINRYTTRMLKGWRKQDFDAIRYNLTLAFGWSIALANRLHIDVQTESWNRFPNICPYCSFKPCRCKVRAKNRSPLETIVGNLDMVNFQKMFREIYPENTAEGSIIHTAEEAGEIGEAIQMWILFTQFKRGRNVSPS